MEFDKLKQAMPARQPITLDFVMRVGRLSSRAHALYWMRQWEAQGLVVHERGAFGKGKWYINE